MAPAGLPAGGADPRLPQMRRRISQAEPWLSDGQSLRVSPASQAPVLQPLGQGVPLRVVRRWLSPGGRTWLHVELGAGGVAGQATRGWLPG
ncbi:MAG: SH3 domain-containing protein [Synechococcaceae cyanobacterium]